MGREALRYRRVPSENAPHRLGLCGHWDRIAVAHVRRLDPDEERGDVDKNCYKEEFTLLREPVR